MRKERRDVLPDEIKDECACFIEQKLADRNVVRYENRKEFEDALAFVLTKDSGGPQEFLLREKNSIVYTNVAEKITFELMHQGVYSTRSEQVGDGEGVSTHLRKHGIPYIIDGKQKGYVPISLFSASGDVCLDVAGSSRLSTSCPRDIPTGLYVLTPNTLGNAVAITKTTILVDHDTKRIYDYPSLRVATQQELRAILDGLRGIGR